MTEGNSFSQIKTTAEPLNNILEKAKQDSFEKEKALIMKVLQGTEGNKTKAAKRLGIHRTTLYQKIKKFGIMQSKHIRL
ncbi:hypothetical protein F9802_13745 [Bacillus aerolatus]|uniref:DNA binding HTH domain-containing protein n=1 Tax=Bacillus aerolatus TaxID=2653354 RepID=A0A6I1FIK4_9BACI|nr:helix-turn-helix domain-containing protein [Bacillus aerolatus]KAB7705594.1 hypothetical protein F9802_13745 [Bacillus aerolatus]